MFVDTAINNVKALLRPCGCHILTFCKQATRVLTTNIIHKYDSVQFLGISHFYWNNMNDLGYFSTSKLCWNFEKGGFSLYLLACHCSCKKISWLKQSYSKWTATSSHHSTCTMLIDAYYCPFIVSHVSTFGWSVSLQTARFYMPNALGHFSRHGEDVVSRLSTGLGQALWSSVIFPQSNKAWISCCNPPSAREDRGHRPSEAVVCVCVRATLVTQTI